MEVIWSFLSGFWVIFLKTGLVSTTCVNSLLVCRLDLAYKKTTEQSSTNYNGFSSRAVDEVYTPYYDSKSCMHTKKEQNPWWRVDLGREYIVTGMS